VLLAAASGPAQHAGAAENANGADQPPVTNVFYETSLRQALSDVAAQTGVTIVPDASVQGLVSCELQEVPLDQALDILLAGTGFQVQKNPRYYLVYSPDPKSPAFPGVSETKVVRLSYITAATARNLLADQFAKYVETGEAYNEEYDRIKDEAGLTMDREERGQLYIQLQQMMDEDVSCIWLTNGASPHVYRDNVEPVYLAMFSQYRYWKKPE
jgi:type II secretory pathway component HofQ